MPRALLLFLFWQPEPAALGMKDIEGQKADLADAHFAAALEATPEDRSANFHYSLALSMVKPRPRSHRRLRTGAR